MAAGGILHAIQFARHRPEPIRQASLLMVLATGVSDTEILEATLKSLANESESPWSDRILQLLMLMQQGLRLSRAAATVKDLLPEESIIAIRIGEESGTLEAALSGEAVRLLSDSTKPASSTMLTLIIEALAVCTVMTGIVTFVMVFIIPKFKAIFEGFGIEFPVLTRALIQMSDNFYGVGIIAWMPTLAGTIGLCVMSWKIQLQLLSQGHSSWLDWRARHRTPMVLRMLSLTTATGITLAEGLRSALSEMMPSRAATQLSRVHHQVNNGAELSSALRSSGFITQREARFLDSATRTNHIDWAMRHLAAAVDRRRKLWFERIGMIIPPLMILGVGAAVCFVVVALYLPLIKLFNSQSDLNQTYP